MHTSIDLISPVGNPLFDARGTAGYTGFVDDPETEALKARYQRGPDPGRRREIATSMQERACDLVFHIPLGSVGFFVAMRPEVADCPSSQILVFWNTGKGRCST